MLIFNNNQIHCAIFISTKHKQIPAIFQFFKVIVATIYINLLNPFYPIDSLGKELKYVRLATSSTIILRMDFKEGIC